MVEKSGPERGSETLKFHPARANDHLVRCPLKRVTVLTGRGVAACRKTTFPRHFREPHFDKDLKNKSADNQVRGAEMLLGLSGSRIGIPCRGSSG